MRHLWSIKLAANEDGRLELMAFAADPDDKVVYQWHRWERRGAAGRAGDLDRGAAQQNSAVSGMVVKLKWEATPGACCIAIAAPWLAR